MTGFISRFSFVVMLTGLLSATACAQTSTDTLKPITMIDTPLVQSDTVKKEAIVFKGDTTKTIPTVKKKKFEPIAKKAGLYSAILPGSGQFYNRQYWKPPIIYAGMAVAGYFFVFNLDKYQTYRKAYFGRLTNGGVSKADESDDIKLYTTDNLKTLQDEYRKYLDLTVLLSAVGYAAQVIDAITYAHLRNFDMSRDISLRFKAVTEPNYVGFGIAMNFK